VQIVRSRNERSFLRDVLGTGTDRRANGRRDMGITGMASMGFGVAAVAAGGVYGEHVMRRKAAAGDADSLRGTGTYFAALGGAAAATVVGSTTAMFAANTMESAWRYGDRQIQVAKFIGKPAGVVFGAGACAMLGLGLGAWHGHSAAKPN
jgi:hypothetical protein